MYCLRFAIYTVNIILARMTGRRIQRYCRCEASSFFGKVNVVYSEEVGAMLDDAIIEEVCRPIDVCTTTWCVLNDVVIRQHDGDRRRPSNDRQSCGTIQYNII